LQTRRPEVIQTPGELEVPGLEPQAENGDVTVLGTAVPVPPETPAPVAVKPRRTSNDSLRPRKPTAIPPVTEAPSLIERVIEHKERIVERPALPAPLSPPSVRIGSIEVVITPPPAAAAPPMHPPAVGPPAYPSAARPGTAPRPLARGFVSAFGFRQE
jgi:hypothetical protein